MAENKIERGKTLGEQTYELLAQRIAAMEPGKNRLPSEEELSREFGVSRVTVREACNQLISEGYVTKGPSRGMVGHPSAFAMKNRIDSISDFRLLLDHRFEKVELRISNVHIRDKACLSTSHPCTWGEGETFCMDWTYYGNGNPMIYGPFEIPVAALREVPQEGLVVNDLPDFCQKYMKVPMAYCAMYIKCVLDEKATTLFGVEQGRPLQCWEETIFDVEDYPVGVQHIYLHPDEVVMSVLTKF